MADLAASAGGALPHLQEWLWRSGATAAFLTAGTNLAYVTGVRLRAMERLAAALVPARGRPVLVVPELEAANLPSAAAFTVQPWADGSDPYAAVAAAARELGVADGPWAVEKSRLTLAEAERLQQALPGLQQDPPGLQQPSPGVQWLDVTPILAGLRAVKSGDELAALQAAADVLAPVIAGLRTFIRPGIAEAEVARHIRDALIAAGADEPSFPAIVLAGARSALPHGRPGAAAASAGALLLCDFGALRAGYCSDVTRTFHLGPWPPDALRLYDLVRRAHDAAIAAIRPGVAPAAVDAAARQVIDAAGYGHLFIHRTGHGLGLDLHEPPWIAAGEQTPLAAGMVFTVEPGVYIPGWGGIRIEDAVAVTAQGCRLLTDGQVDPAQMVIPV